jgi:hypothetical protein
MSKSKGKRFVLPKPSNSEDLNTDFSSRLEYYDDEKRGILNIVRIKPRPTRKSASKSATKSASKSATKSASKSVPKTPKPTTKTSKSATKTPKSRRVMSRT